MGHEIDWNKYYRRCEENQKAIERLTGKPMPLDEQERLGIMIYRELRAEAQAKQ